MSKIDRNQSCISQLRRLFKVKRSNNIIENGPLWIGYSELFFKVNVQVFFVFHGIRKWEKQKRQTISTVTYSTLPSLVSSYTLCVHLTI